MWAPYWYRTVHGTTAFAPYVARSGSVPARLEPVLGECRPFYETLYRHALKAHPEKPEESA